ncbi:DUF84 family protein, partial [Bacillus paranthracis]|uniref:DUF84 family protein n=1 Tax=Bacillus paranthracis TaxID=2026186 RepID=UPI00284F3854
MEVVIVSKNKTKVGAVDKVWKEATITSLSVTSGVAAQPCSGKETMKGAINKAKRALEEGETQISIGLEGGVM